MLDKVEMLERLTALWKAGTLSDDEFQQQKAAFLKGFSPPSADQIRLPPDNAPLHERMNGRTFVLAGLGAVSAALLTGVWFVGSGSDKGAANYNRGATSLASSGPSGEESRENWSNDLFWDGKPVGPTNKCQTLKITGSAELGMMAGPNWAQGYDTPGNVKDKIKAVGGLTTGIIYRDGKCQAAFQVNAVVEGTAYKWRAVCPFHTDPSEPDVITMVMLEQCRWY